MTQPPEERMKGTSSLCISAALACGLALGASTAAVAQKPAARAPTVHHRATGQSAMAPKPAHRNTFKGIATKLNTTPEELQTAYAAAKQANPKLTRGQFVAANMVAHNLSAKNPNITTQAILDGLQSGKSMGQTLQSLGLSEKDAKEAEASAKREAKQAEKATGQ